ncbi:hypothetical protein [uncultured Sphingomonas sp.]|uniref:hypothetical protein n=1 Tax=uncultured Sphingomonas sp. TaxID=158754 RepID=UPI0035CA8C86
MTFLLAVMLAIAIPERPPPAALPPQDWSALPQLTLRHPADPTAAMSAYVRQEVLQGRCASAIRAPAGWTLPVDIAVLASADGAIRRVVPRAIHCPTVEQYAAGIVFSGVRDNVDLPAGVGDRWYRTRLTFAWSP